MTTVTRGVSGAPASGAQARYADRADTGELEAVLGEDTWDAVIDTWSLAPRVVRDSARLLADRTDHYGYVSSRSVYAWPIPPRGDETAPVVDADADSEEGDDYAAAKMGGELAVLRYFDGRAVFARAGLILGPYERVGRMPWWLRRIERGGDVLAPGPRDLPLQYIDCRDLARWMLQAAEDGRSGAFNTVSRPGHATMESLLNAAVAATASDARLVWTEPEILESAGVQEWTELPVWANPNGEAASLHDGNVDAVYAAGLVCRPVQDTVTDTWHWLQAEGDPDVRPDRPIHGIDPEKERVILATVLTPRNTTPPG